MKVTWVELTGWPSQLYLRTVVAALTRRRRSFYVGITSDPVRRSYQHRRRRKRYGEMVVIYRSNSLDNVRQVEKDLVGFFWRRVDNERDGGGGKDGGPPYFVYLLRRS